MALTHPWLLIWCIYIYEYVSFSFALVRGFIAFWAFQDLFKCSNGEWALYLGCMIWLVKVIQNDFSKKIKLNLLHGHMPRIIYENGMDNNITLARQYCFNFIFKQYLQNFEASALVLYSRSTKKQRCKIFTDISILNWSSL